MAAKTLSGSGVLYTDRRQFYLSPQITKELWTTVAPFTTVVANRNTVTGLADPLFKMFEHRDPWRIQKFVYDDSSPETLVSNDSESNALTIDGIVGLNSAIDSSYVGLICDIFDTTEVTRKGQVLITSMVAATSIDVKNLTGASIVLADNDVFYVVGSAFGEGATAPEAWADELRTVWGSTQIMRTSIEITGTLLQAALRGYSKELARLRMMKNKEHKMQKERAFLFGRSLIGTNLDVDAADTFSDTHRTDTSSRKVRTTTGLITALETYGKSSGDTQNLFSITEASYKYSNFVDDMEKVFQYYPEDGFKYAFCGAGAISYWSKLDGSAYMSGKSGWQVKIGPEMRDSLGFNVRQLETPHGSLLLVLTPALRGPFAKFMVCASDENLSHVQYRTPRFNANIKTDDGYDGVKDEFFSDEGIGMTLIESHQRFKIV